MKKNISMQMLKMKNKKILQTLKKYIAQQKTPIDKEILKTEILLLFKK
jgi:hypothetical protein|tara:strand:+ start:1031 stop:1174 length:144 start_codon:yes stop_codon:yes gene_type:complete